MGFIVVLQLLGEMFRPIGLILHALGLDFSDKDLE